MRRGPTSWCTIERQRRRPKRLPPNWNATRSGSALCRQADLLDIEALSALVDATVVHFGRLDALVNNASKFLCSRRSARLIWPTGTICWAAIWKAPLFLTQAAAPHLKAAHGAVVNITDIHAERPLAGYSLYCAAKAGLLGLTRVLAIELAPEVRVNAVAPGPILWPDDSAFDGEARERIVAHTLLGHAAQSAGHCACRALPAQ